MIWRVNCSASILLSRQNQKLMVALTPSKRNLGNNLAELALVIGQIIKSTAHDQDNHTLWSSYRITESVYALEYVRRPLAERLT